MVSLKILCILFTKCLNSTQKCDNNYLSFEFKLVDKFIDNSKPIKALVDNFSDKSADLMNTK